MWKISHLFDFIKFLTELFFIWWDYSLNSGFCICKAGILLLEPHLQPIFSDYFGDGVS
jgi:hypothetical protein